MHSFQMVEKVVPAPQCLPAHGARDKVQQVVPCLFFPCVENTTTNAALKIVSEACWEATIAVSHFGGMMDTEVFETGS